MKRMIRIIVGLTILFLLAVMTNCDKNKTSSGSSAETYIRVPRDYPTIQAAIDAAKQITFKEDGTPVVDEIVVSEGIYYENIRFEGKIVILRSFDPTNPEVVAKTIIDGNQNGSVVTFGGNFNDDERQETYFPILSGFTIRNGNSENGGGINGCFTLARVENNVITNNSARYGGGISSCAGFIQNNVIKDNSAVFGGGGLKSCRGIRNNVIANNLGDVGGGLFVCLDIQNNVIKDNSARIGGGLYGCGNIENNVITNNSASDGDGGGLFNCSVIKNNIISYNSAKGDGGGFMLYGGIQGGRIENNIICFNSAKRGGGLACYTNTYITNNTIYGNSAVYTGGGVFGNSPIVNCIIWGNTVSDSEYILPDDGTTHPYIPSPGPKEAQYHLYPSGQCTIYIPSRCCIQEWTGIDSKIPGNIITDNPKFVDADNGDFHLRPDSPCIDAGMFIENITTEDFDGDLRPFGAGVDIGADEFIAE